MTNSGTYRVDLGNGKFYFGSAVNLRRREREHRRGLEKGNHYNRMMQRSFDKYGVFEFSVVGRWPVDEVIAREQVLLDEHFNDPKCANQQPTAGSNLGFKFSTESRARMSAAQTGLKRSPETKANMSAAIMGKKYGPPSAEHRAKISAALRGKKRGPHSAETRANMSAAHMGKKHLPETKAKIAAAQMGRKHSPETRAKMSAAAKARYAPLC